MGHIRGLSVRSEGRPWIRWSGVELADPDAEPDPDWTPGHLSRALHRARDAWRPWMTVALLAVVVVLAAVVPVPGRVVSHERLLDASTVVAVTVDTRTDPGGERSGHTGTYLVPLARAPVTPVDVVVAAGRSDQHVTGADPPLVQGFAPVESALLMGAGIAPGRAEAADVGLSATVDDAHVAPTALGVLLEILDQAAPIDLSAGRTVLALGTLDAEGRLGCPQDGAASLTAAPDSVDVVLVGLGCAADLDAAGAPVNATVIETAGLPDALTALSPGQ